MSTKSTLSFATVSKFIIKAFGLLVVFGTIGFFLWRVFASGNPKALERLTPNDTLHHALVAAEAETDPESGKSGSLLVWKQYQKDYITSVPDKNYGYFAVTDAKFIPEAEQVQILFRYNNSTIRHLKEDYALDKMPDRDEELYDVTLYVVYDLTPDNPNDNAGNIPEAVRGERYHATLSVADKKNLYNYRKLVFDGIDLTPEEHPLLAIYVDFYYKGDIDYEKDSYGTLPIYFYDAEWTIYETGKKELASIRNHKPRETAVPDTASPSEVPTTDTALPESE